MSSVFIVKRELEITEKHPEQRFRFVVRWSEGRAYKAKHLGSYPTRKLAETRQRAVLEQLARGEVPTLRILPATRHATTTTRILCERWFETRVDVKDTTRANFRNSIKNIVERWGDDDPHTISSEDVQAWVADQTAAKKSPGTIKNRLGCLSQILAYGKVEPNPVRDVKLPKGKRRKSALPSRAELARMYAVLPEKNRGVVALMEHGGLRVSSAVAVTWGDWDRPRRRLLVNDKTAAGERWITQIDGLPVMPERPDGVADDARVHQNVTAKSVHAAMVQACKQAGIRRVTPHSLRHLHASRLMHEMAMSPAEVAVRMGHASPSTTIALYTHLVPPEG
ncbi:MAG: tyrosine-type recombinase/integrase [Actinobacteria bacterium]|nr:tyrosine-type recombinase/integrase [Actinomycetota bacterium]